MGTLRRILCSALCVVSLLAMAIPGVAVIRGPSIAAPPFQWKSLMRSKSWSSGMPAGAGRLRIGAPVSEKLTIGNNGTAAQVFLSCEIHGDSSFAQGLSLVVRRESDRVRLYGGPATGLRTISVGRVASKASMTLQVQVTLGSLRSPSGDNANQARRASLAFLYSASQA
jgi:hypothetical protein